MTAAHELSGAVSGGGQADTRPATGLLASCSMKSAALQVRRLALSPGSLWLGWP